MKRRLDELNSAINALATNPNADQSDLGKLREQRDRLERDLDYMRNANNEEANRLRVEAEELAERANKQQEEANQRAQEAAAALEPAQTN